MRVSGWLAALGAALILAGAVAALLDPSLAWEQPEPPVLPSVLAALGALALALAAWLGRGFLRRALAARQARFGLFTAAYGLAVLAGLGAIAFLAERHSLQLDLTRDRKSTLEPDTLRVLRSIPAEGSDLRLVGFVGGGALTGVDTESALQELGPLFRLIEKASPHVRTHFADASREPDLTRALGVTRLPSVAVSWTAPGEEAPRVVRTDLLSEEAVTRAIEHALLGTRRVGYVLTGHDEMEPGSGSGGIESALGALVGDNHDIRPLTLLDEGAVPADASFVMLPGPQQDLLDAEVGLLDAYLRGGGRLLLLLGPSFDRSGAVQAQPVLEAWLGERLGVRLSADVACDLEGLQSGASDLRWLTLRPMENRVHPIVRGQRSLVVFPFARTLDLDGAYHHGVTVTELLRTGHQSWSERDTPARPAFDPADERGPHVVGMAITHQPDEERKAARIVLFGSHLFLANRVIGLAGNSSLLLDTVAWLGEREEVIQARQRTRRDGTAVIPYSQGMMIILCAAAIPVIVACFGVVTWWHRRRL